MGSLSPRIDVFAVPRVFPVLLIGDVLRTPALKVHQPQRGLKMRPNFVLYGAAAAAALVTLATVAEATPSYESDYGHVDEYKSNNYKHEAKYPSSYESDNYKHEPSYGSHYEEDYGYEEYTPSHYKPKYSTAPSYKHKPSYMHKRSVEYGSPYGSQSYKHKQSVGYGSPHEYATRPSYRHRRAILGHHQSHQKENDDDDDV